MMTSGGLLTRTTLSYDYVPSSKVPIPAPWSLLIAGVWPLEFVDAGRAALRELYFDDLFSIQPRHEFYNVVLYQ
jgi:hypothetical protein